jgi:transcription antitermination factor NusG
LSTPISASSTLVHNPDRLWFALEVQNKLAASVCHALTEKGYESLHATYQVTRRWCDRTSVSEVPLFPGYLFAKFDPNDRFPVVVTQGVRRVVSFGRTPAAIPTDEIESIKVALQSGLPLEPHNMPAVGQWVAITSGPLASVKGVLMDVRKGLRVILSVPLINRSVAVEIDYNMLRALDTSELASISHSDLLQLSP